MTANALDARGAEVERVRELLEVQLLAHPTPATVEAIARLLTTPDRRMIAPNGGDVLTALGEALSLLVRDGSARRVPGGYVLASFSPYVSRRQRTLSLTGRSVVALDRAVRAGDVWTYTQQYAPGEVAMGALSLALVARDMQNLTRTGDLVVVDEVRGDPASGRLLVVPSAMVSDKDNWLPVQPLTWLAYVAMHVAALLTVSESATSQTPATSFTTRQLRARFEGDVENGVPLAQSRYGVDLTHPMTVTLALQILSKGSDPLLRPVANRRAVWTLVSTESSATEAAGSYACDSDRLLEASRRVMARPNTCLVTAQDVSEELERDPVLALKGRGRVASMLTDLARERVDDGSGCRVARCAQRVRRIGTLKGQATYWVATGEDDERTLAQARVAVAMQGIVQEIWRAKIGERFASLGNVQSPLVALGRARQLREEVAAFVKALGQVSAQASGFEECREELRHHERLLDGWLKFRSPNGAAALVGIQREAGGLTALELRDLFAPVNPAAAAMQTAGQVIRHYSRLIRRAENPEFEGRRSGDPKTAATYLFDPVDSAAYAARQWGGPTCQLMALWAEEEVGELRDPRYVFEALRTDGPDQRMRLLGALALMRAGGAEEVLTKHARDDVHAGVRESALWAVGMLMGTGADALLREAIAQDQDAGVRRAAAIFLSVGANWWWRV